MAGRYPQFFPSSGGGLRSQVAVAEDDKTEALDNTRLASHHRYLTELLGERQKLGPFMPVLPNCSRLLNQEIIRVTALVGNSPIVDQDGLDHRSPISSGAALSNGVAGDLNGRGGPQPDRFGMSQGTSVAWHAVQGSRGLGGPMVKKTQRIEVPVDKHPNFNFVGRILGPRGNSLKRVEATTGCRVLIRGRGSIKDGAKEDKMRDKPGFDHLNEPLHLLVEAELPANVVDKQLSHARDILEELLKPVDETFDLLKKAQLRELAVLNGTLRDDNPGFFNATISPSNNSGMKRAKMAR
ncbi:unnamed protein product [Calypogeia fissa]